VTVGIADTKTEVVQVAVLRAIILAEPMTWGAVSAILVATFGIMLLSVKGALTWRDVVLGLAERPALLGLAVGAGYAITALTIRGATQSLHSDSFVGAGALALVTMLGMQTFILVTY